MPDGTAYARAVGASLGPDALYEMAEHIVAFTVTTIAPGTNGAPPRGTIDVRDVLRGSVTKGPHVATFPAPNDASWYAIRNGQEAEWNAQRLDGPAVADDLIAMVTPQPDGSLLVEPRTVWPDNDGRRARAVWKARAAVTIITTEADDIDQFEALTAHERRERTGGWKRFPVRSGRLLDTFLMFATHVDLGVYQCETKQVDGDPLTTSLWPQEQVIDVLPTLVKLVETNATDTVHALHEHGGGTADVSRIAEALATGVWPENGDPAEETAAFAFHLLRYARTAEGDLYGVCWEWRGDLRAQVSDALTERTRALEATYARFRAGDATRDAVIESLSTMTRPEIEAWAFAHYAFLGAYVHESVERGDTPTAIVAERAQWAEVRAGTRALVEQFAPLPDDAFRYELYFAE